MLLHSQRVERLKLWTSFVSLHSASQRNTVTQRANFAPFLSNQVISNFPLFFSSFFSFFSRFYLIVRLFFSPKDMKLQAAIIFTSLQNAKFTSIVGYTSCGPTYIESFMTIFGQCINVLNNKINYESLKAQPVNRSFLAVKIRGAFIFHKNLG